MKTSLLYLLLFCTNRLLAQNVGIGTTTPQATLDVRGNSRTGGLSKYISFDSVSGKISWNNANLFVPAPQYLMQHSASAEGLYYGNGKLMYRGSVGDTAFYTDWQTGNGSFKNFLGIGTASPFTSLHIESTTGNPPVYVNGTPFLYMMWAENGAPRGYLGSYYGNPEDVDLGTHSANSTGKLHLVTGATPRLTVGATGNVGIGNQTPSEKLDVAGNVKATDFKFATPKVCYYTLSGVDFDPEVSSDTAVKSMGLGEIHLNTNVVGKGLLAPLHLPQGAVLQNLTVYLTDFSPVANLTVLVMRKSMTGNVFADNLGSITSAGSAGEGSYSTPLYSADAVNNQAYIYYVAARVYNNFPWSSMYLRSAVIQYTVSAAE